MVVSLKACLLNEIKLIDVGVNDVFEPEISVEPDRDGDIKKLVAVEYFVAPFNGKQALWVRKSSGEELPWKMLPDSIELPKHAKKLPPAIDRYK